MPFGGARAAPPSRSNTIASEASARAGTRASSRAPGFGRPSASRPPSTTAMSPSSVTRPITAHGIPHRAQIAAIPGRRSGRAMTTIRSCDSLISTSNGAMPGSRRGIASRSTRIPGPRAIGRLRDAAGDAGRAQVREALREAGREDLQGRLDQELLRERVTHLHGRPLRGVLVAERRRGEDRRAADPVAPGGRAVQDHEVAGPRRRGSHDRVLADQPDRHDVDQRVALVRRVEDELAADRRDADAVAVAADAAHDPVDEVPRSGIRRVAEAERIEDGDRPGAHREDVAQDAADAGRRALVRLHRGRMVVRFDLERDRPAVADPHHAGVLARAGDDVVSPGRQRPEERPAALVRAMLAPHHAEHRELEIVRPAAQLPLDRGELLVGQPERAVERRAGRPEPGPGDLALIDTAR